MKQIVILWISMCVLCAGRPLKAQQQGVVANAVERFCSRDAEGERLTGAGATRVFKDLFWEEPQLQDSGRVILVINGYSVKESISQKGVQEITVDYRVLGRIDHVLDFIRMQGTYTNQPLVQSERFSLVFTNRHFELDVNGKPQPINGIPEWRIKTAPVAPHVNLEAAIQYVRGASNKTKDPLIRARAQKTLADLEVLSRFQSMPMLSAGPSQQQPEDVLSQFAQMQMDDAGLTSGEFSQLGMFLVHPPQWRQDKIGVARGFGIKRTSFAFNKAEAYVQYDAVGEIDLQLRFMSSGANGNNVRQTYKLVFDNDYSSVPSGGGPYAKIGPSRWRIEDAGPEQWVSVETAIRYVSQVRDATRDPAIKANADKTLAALTHLR